MEITSSLAEQHATVYPEVNLVLARLLSGIQVALGDQFVGLYLYGSLSAGDFNPDSSDIDFVCVTRELLPDTTVDALAALHAALWASGLTWAARLEGAYLPGTILRRAAPAGPLVPTVNEGRFYRARLGSDWDIQRYIVREQGRVLAGPPPVTLIDQVPPVALRLAVLGVLSDWWLPMLDDSSWLRRAEYQAFAVLTMCRALYTLAQGSVASKPASARWAMERLPDRFGGLVEWALGVKHGPPDTKDAAPGHRLDEVLAFVRFALGQAGLLAGSSATG